MSTAYRFLDVIKTSALRKAMKKCGVEEKITENTCSDSLGICLQKNGEYMWCYLSDDGKTVLDFCRYGDNYGAEQWLGELAEELNTCHISEHDDGYFDDEEESCGITFG